MVDVRVVYLSSSAIIIISGDPVKKVSGPVPLVNSWYIEPAMNTMSARIAILINSHFLLEVTRAGFEIVL